MTPEPPPERMKRCSRCGTLKLASHDGDSEFYIDRTRGDWLSWCKTCNKEHLRTYRREWMRRRRASQREAGVKPKRYRRPGPRPSPSVLGRLKAARRKARCDLKQRPKSARIRARLEALEREILRLESSQLVAAIEHAKGG